MPNVPYQVLRRELSKWLDAAASGKAVVVTRREKPIARLSRVEPDSVRVGANHLKGRLLPLFLRKTGGAYLAALHEDRGRRNEPTS